MAWSAPSASEFSVGQVVTASVMNAKIANNLRYLKGLDGAVTIEDELIISTTTFPGLRVQGAGADEALQLANSGAGGLTYRIDSTSNASGYGGGRLAIVEEASGNRIIFDGATGHLGIGTAIGAAPQGRLHVSGPAGGGFAVFSANDVTSLQTPVVAGTVVSGCAMWLWDRNNTTGVAVLGFNGQSFSLSSAPTYVNSDTITVTLTAGGAITVQRTTGTNGSHDINMFILFY